MRQIFLVLLLVIAAIGGGCSDDDNDDAGLANPASVFCEEQGGTLENRTNDIGAIGYCIFDDGSGARNGHTSGANVSPATTPADRPPTRGDEVDRSCGR